MARYLEDVRFEIDNNWVEDAVPPQTWRKALTLFCGSEHAGHHAAFIYTLVENCRRQGIPVEKYLYQLLTRLPCEAAPEIIASFTPARMAASARHEKSAIE